MTYRKQKRDVLLQLISEKSQEFFEIFRDTGRYFDSEIKGLGYYCLMKTILGYEYYCKELVKHVSLLRKRPIFVKRL